jgi:hypothetical protein
MVGCHLCCGVVPSYRGEQGAPDIPDMVVEREVGREGKLKTNIIQSSPKKRMLH